VTGSSGLIGGALGLALNQKCKVVGFDNEGPPHPPENFDWLSVDLTSDESVQNAFHILEHRIGTKIDSVFHFAAYYSFSGEDSDMYDKVTVHGTERLLRGLERFDVGQFVFSSSMLVHKPTQPGERISEVSEIEGTWAYPNSKIETEKLLERTETRFPKVILRVAGVYDDDCHSIPIAHQIQRIYEKQLTGIFYPGDVEVGQTFIHLGDLIDACVTVFEKRNELPDPFTVLIGEEEAASYADIQETISQALYQEPSLIEPIPKPIAKAGAWVQDKIGDSFIKPWMIDRVDDHYALDISRAKIFLDWRPEHKVLETIPLMIEKLKADPLAWYEMNKLEAPDWLKRKSA
ncbi:MAG TPA: NAD(P)-dependent oxidoreductase, partial [Candidatus Melainabacteria bacterium]|nr:NAD(P)-dependent oxidoreductase [Candidatus Melainabacteria bacterium]